MAGLCEGGNKPPGSLKASKTALQSLLIPHSHTNDQSGSKNRATDQLEPTEDSEQTRDSRTHQQSAKHQINNADTNNISARSATTCDPSGESEKDLIYEKGVQHNKKQGEAMYLQEVKDENAMDDNILWWLTERVKRREEKRRHKRTEERRERKEEKEQNRETQENRKRREERGERTGEKTQKRTEQRKERREKNTEDRTEQRRHKREKRRENRTEKREQNREERREEKRSRIVVLVQLTVVCFNWLWCHDIGGSGSTGCGVMDISGSGSTGCGLDIGGSGSTLCLSGSVQLLLSWT
ncbi:hypothetical protein ANN_16835 [Periplaneta americana]|uniref:Uncharacterized protein n=1 Tax=Periplaneta americana TaxID=6978 RepID=A0ABQ8SRT3_PERAM|nr:hypothetical protein ANN_16835 [Periplaneta americana]